jgi:glycosyltransferase involved in cell wall biosynthesis
LSQQYLGKNIFFHGKQEHAKIPDFINSADIMISYVPKVAYFEYQPPTKLIEYLACNKPSLATNTIAQEELLRGYEFLLH